MPESALCSFSEGILLLHWVNTEGGLTGSYQHASLRPGFGPRSVVIDTGDLAGVTTGGQISLNLMGATWDGNYTSRTLELNVPQDDGTLFTVECAEATPSDWNRALSKFKAVPGRQIPFGLAAQVKGVPHSLGQQTVNDCGSFIAHKYLKPDSTIADVSATIDRDEGAVFDHAAYRVHVTMTIQNADGSSGGVRRHFCDYDDSGNRGYDSPE